MVRMDSSKRVVELYNIPGLVTLTYNTTNGFRGFTLWLWSSVDQFGFI